MRSSSSSTMTLPTLLLVSLLALMGDVAHAQAQIYTTTLPVSVHPLPVSFLLGFVCLCFREEAGCLCGALESGQHEVSGATMVCCARRRRRPPEPCRWGVRLPVARSFRRTTARPLRVSKRCQQQAIVLAVASRSGEVCLAGRLTLLSVFGCEQSGLSHNALNGGQHAFEPWERCS